MGRRKGNRLLEKEGDTHPERRHRPREGTDTLRKGREAQRKRDSRQMETQTGAESPRDRLNCFTPPLELFSEGKLTLALVGGVGRGHPIPLRQPKYSMARWQEGCPRIRVFPSLLPIPGQGGCGCLLGWGRGPAHRSVHWSHFPDLSRLPPSLSILPAPPPTRRSLWNFHSPMG